MAKEKLIFSIIFVSLLFRLLFIAWPLENWLLSGYDYLSFEKAYLGSQYVTKDSPGIIPDDTVYDYAAGFYLRGGSPILVNPEQPPLGKYFLSLSLLLFNNTKTAIYLFFFFTLFGLFLLSKEIFKNNTLSLLVVLMASFDKNLLNQLKVSPMLDIIQISFIAFSFYFFLKWIENNQPKNLLLASLSLGCTVAVKFFITAAVVFFSWLVFLILKRKKKQIIPLIFWSGLLTYLILVLSYFRVLMQEPNPLKVLSIQKWIYWYHQNKLTSIGTIWPLIYFNRWQTWWGDYSIIQDPQWWLGLPILFTLSFLTALLYAIFSKRKNPDAKMEIILIWFVSYCLFISLAQASLRYVIPILPFIYLISIRGLTMFWHEVIKPKI